MSDTTTSSNQGTSRVKRGLAEMLKGGVIMDVSFLISPLMVRMWRVASDTSPVPASPFERIIAAPSVMRRSASPRLVAPHTNGTVKFHLSMWLM
jgi:pyridoxal 5'-phosphate synthase pdxS subunit